MTREEILQVAKPILFNTEMVNAILDDRKTVTRRVIKPQPMGNMSYGFYSDLPNAWVDVAFVKHTAPYRPGNYLYVRETWLRLASCEGCMCDNEPPDQNGCYLYRATHGDAEGLRWHPSIHMPKEAARLFLRVKDIRVERLQDITDEQAEKEGITSFTKDSKVSKFAPSLEWWEEYRFKHRREFKGTWWQDMPRESKAAFAKLWDSAIKPADLPQYGWEANPWVWVIEFERVVPE